MSQPLSFAPVAVDSAEWGACVRSQAGWTCFHWDKGMELISSSSLRVSCEAHPGYLLLWCFLKRAAKEGDIVADLRRNIPNSATHEYQQQSDGCGKSLRWHYRSADRMVGAPSPVEGAYSMGPRLRKKLPVGPTTFHDPKVARSIP